MAFELFVDEGGVPYSDYGIYEGLQIGRQRSVLSVAERGLWYWDNFGFGRSADKALLSCRWNRFPKDRSRNPADAAAARPMLGRCADWLLDNLRQRRTSLVWEYGYPMTYGTAAGWCSAHAQAVGMQLLCRMHELTGDAKYLSPLPGLLQAYRVPIVEGGLLDDSDPSLPWYEKFADPGNQKPKVLNGMLFAIIGLQDVADRVGNAEARALAREGAHSAQALLERFDLGDWSAYDILGKPASSHYHAIHIKQMALAHQLFGGAVFADYLNRFERYRDARSAANASSPAQD